MRWSFHLSPVQPKRAQAPIQPLANRHLRNALILLAAFGGWTTWGSASVTGRISGTVVDAKTSVPVAGVQVTAVSSTQTENSTTDAKGHFTFRSLTPDTYTITASKDGYEVTSVAGQVVSADTSQIVSLKIEALRTIAHVISTTHGNGVITPVRSWQNAGRDCYFGRYTYTYPDGVTESGNILWPFCYDQGADPFKQQRHPIPFPLPLPGFRLPVGAQMPPIEKAVYEKWAAANVSASSPP